PRTPHLTTPAFTPSPLRPPPSEPKNETSDRSRSLAASQPIGTQGPGLDHVSVKLDPSERPEGAALSVVPSLTLTMSINHTLPPNDPTAPVAPLTVASDVSRTPVLSTP